MNKIENHNLLPFPEGQPTFQKKTYKTIEDFVQTRFSTEIANQYLKEGLHATFKHPKEQKKALKLFCKKADAFLASIPVKCPALPYARVENMVLKELLPFYRGTRTLEASVDILNQQIKELGNSFKHLAKLTAKRFYVQKLARDENVQNLSRTTFNRWLIQVSSHLEPRLSVASNEHSMKMLLQEMQLRRRYEAPVIKSLGSFGGTRKPVLPEVEFVPIDKLHSGIVNYQGAYFTKEAFEKHLASHPSSKKLTLRNLKEILPQLLRLDYIPWNYDDDGCYLRSDITNHLLLAMGVPPHQVSKKCLILPNSHDWTYHVAACVKIGSKEWVIDPLAFDDKEDCELLEATDWVEAFTDTTNLTVMVADSSKSYPNTDFPQLINLPNDLSMHNEKFRKMPMAVTVCHIMERALFCERSAFFDTIDENAPQLFSMLVSEDWKDTLNYHEISFNQVQKATVNQRDKLPSIEGLRRMNFSILHQFSGKTPTKLADVLLELQMKCELLKFELKQIYGKKLKAKLESVEALSSLIEKKLKELPASYIDSTIYHTFIFLRWMNGTKTSLPEGFEVKKLALASLKVFAERGWQTIEKLLAQAAEKMDSKDPHQTELLDRIDEIVDEIDQQTRLQEKIHDWTSNSGPRPSLQEFMLFKFSHCVWDEGDSRYAISLCQHAKDKVDELLKLTPNDQGLKSIKEHLEEEYAKLQSLLCDKILHWSHHELFPLDELKLLDLKAVEEDTLPHLSKWAQKTKIKVIESKLSVDETEAYLTALLPLESEELEQEKHILKKPEEGKTTEPETRL